jgi:hypothetical protein
MNTIQRRTPRVAKFVSISGDLLEATAENYAHDASCYIGGVCHNMRMAEKSENPAHLAAFAEQAGIMAKIATHSALMALQMGYVA